MIQDVFELDETFLYMYVNKGMDLYIGIKGEQRCHLFHLDILDTFPPSTDHTVKGTLSIDIFSIFRLVFLPSSV